MVDATLARRPGSCTSRMDRPLRSRLTDAAFTSNMRGRKLWREARERPAWRCRRYATSPRTPSTACLSRACAAFCPTLTGAGWGGPPGLEWTGFMKRPGISRGHPSEQCSPHGRPPAGGPVSRNGRTQGHPRGRGRKRLLIRAARGYREPNTPSCWPK